MSLALDLRSIAPGLTGLEHAILETLAYSDVFDYPLRLEELHLYLTSQASRDDLMALLKNMNGSVYTAEGFYFLPGRRSIIALRRRREAASGSAFKRAVFYGRILSIMPFIRMVGVTGSLAVHNCDAKGDFDYMLVVVPGRLWLARAFTILLNRIALLFGDTLCPNLMVSERALEWQQRNLYSAHEICQLFLVSGEDHYARLRAANEWTNSFLPNARSNVSDHNFRGASNVAGTVGTVIQFLLEIPFRGKLGDWLEAWEMKRKIARFTRQAGYGSETVFTPDVCQGNFAHHGARTCAAFRARLEELGLSPSVE